MPGYWMHETSGALRPVVEAYLHDEPLTGEQLAVMRAYLRQWIGAWWWFDDDKGSLATLRERIETLTDQPAIERWLADARTLGIDPI